MGNRKWQVTASVGLVAVVTLVSFFSSLDNDFVDWDDYEYVVENPLLKDLSWGNLKTIFSSFHFSNYHPLILLSFSLEHALWGLNPFGYHLTNLLLHIGNSLLVFALVLRLSSHPLSALVAALLFGVHPLHVESVAWVTERKDVLSTLFFLSSLLCYLKYQESQQVRFYILSLISFMLCLLAKPMGVTLPLILFLCDYLKGRGWSRWVVGEKVPFVMVGGVFAVVTVVAQRAGGAINAARFSAWADNVLVACWGLVFYLGKILAPAGLSAFYPYPVEVSLSLPSFFLSVVVLVMLAIGVWVSQQYTRTVVFGSLFFFVTLLPVLKVVPFGGAAAADRYMYIPSIGLFYLVGVAFCWLYSRQMRWEREKRRSLIVLLGAVLVTLSVLTWQRGNAWQDSKTLWLSVLARYPGVALAHNSLGKTYWRQGLLEAAVAEYKQALALDPTYAEAHNNLGLAYGRKGLLEAAVAEYKQALAFDPRNVDARNNLGNAYWRQGLLEAAISEYEKALALDPTYADVHNNIGNVWRMKGDLKQAILHYRQAMALNPYEQVVYYGLASALHADGQLQAATAVLHRALARFPDDPVVTQMLREWQTR